ncbi:MAG TPA: hypothetical protein VF533_17610 [Solirubrobacteraceae bacterium]|jgi:hypothetical protein
MRPLSRSLRAAALTLAAAFVLAPSAHAVRPHGKLRTTGPVKVVKPFKGKAAARPLASAAAAFGHGGFAGVGDTTCCHNPSELGGAVGDTQFVQVDANQVTVFDRYGAQLKQQPISAFGGANASEPRVLFDRFLHRWFIVTIDTAQPQGISVYTSKTSSATGAYYAVGYSLPGAGGLSRNLRMGMDTEGLFLVWDQFTEGAAYARTGAIALSKAYLTNGKFQSVGFYDALPPLTPPVVMDANRPGSYFIAAHPDGDKLRVYQATSMHRGGPLGFKFDVAVPAYSNAFIATQSSPMGILVGDVNFKGSSYQVGDLVMNTHTISRGGRPTARWYAINVETEALARAGRLFESATSDDFAPTLAAAGDSVFFTWTSTDTHNATLAKRHDPRMRYAAYKAGDATTNKFGYAAVTGDEYVPAEGTDAPWGRGQVTVAPKGFNACADDTYAFAIGQFAANSTRWQGYVKKFGTC